MRGDSAVQRQVSLFPLPAGRVRAALRVARRARWARAVKAFSESKVRRWPKGTPVDPSTGAGGGRFAPKNGAPKNDDSSADSPVPKPSPNALPESRIVKRVIDTDTDPDQEFGGAAELVDGELVAYHVTDDPTVLARVLNEGGSLQRGLESDRYRELGDGLYASTRPDYWMSRSNDKWSFLVGMTKEERARLAGYLREEVLWEQKRRLITESEAQYALRDLDSFVETGNEWGVLQLAALPFAIRMWEPDWLRERGFEPGKQPAVVEVRARGRFAVVDMNLLADESEMLQRLGYDGAILRAGMSTTPQIVIWNREAVTRFGDYYVKGRTATRTQKAFDESKIRRWPKGTPVDAATGAGGGRFAPKDAAEAEADAPAASRLEASLVDLDEDTLADYGVDKAWIESLMPDLRGMDGTLDAYEQEDHEYGDRQLWVAVRLWVPENEDGDYPDVRVDLKLHKDGSATWDYLVVNQFDERLDGYGGEWVERVFARLKEAGFNRVRLYADISIGTYAWAKFGFRYARWVDVEGINNRFRRWAAYQGVPEPEGGWPYLTTPQAFANLDVPGVTLRGRDIDNPDVPKDMEMHVGKAFMLDGDSGHRAWDGWFDLEHWELTRKAARPSLAGHGSGVILWPSGEPLPDGATDYAFWADWLARDRAPSAVKAGAVPPAPADEGAGLSPLPAAIADRVRAFEEQVRGAGREHVAVFTASGDLIEAKTGDDDEVTVRVKPGDIRGSVVTHNHPDDAGGFSLDDVVAAIDGSLRELRAVTPDYVYRLQLPPIRDKAQRQALIRDLRPLWHRHVDGVREEAVRAIQSGRCSKEDAQRDLFHEVARRTVRDLLGAHGFRYTREAWPSPPAARLAVKAFDESKIRRWPKGTPVDPSTGAGGGRFAPKEAPEDTGEGSPDSGPEAGEGEGGVPLTEVGKVDPRYLYEREKAIRMDDRENALVWDATGSLIFRKRQGVDFVELDGLDPYEAAGGVLTHNHPLGSSFSVDDVRVAMRLALKEMRVVSRKYLYRLHLPDDELAVPEQMDVLYKLNTVDKQVEREWTEKIRRGEISIEWANENHAHERMTRLKDTLARYGIRYERVPWDWWEEANEAGVRVADL